MSNFSTGYQEVLTLIRSALSTHTELNNPYVVTDEADLMYDNGWTLGIAEGLNSNRNICNRITFARDLNLIQTHRYFAPSRDIAARIAAEKKIIDDQITVLKELVPHTSSAIYRISYASDSGINFLEGDRFGILQLDTVISVEYYETY